MSWSFKDRPPPERRYPIGDFLLKLSEKARQEERDYPTIEMDRWAAQMLVDQIVLVEMGARPIDFAVKYGQANILLIYDGIKIVARHVDVCQHEVDAGWREHFGPLADIWS